VIVKFGANTWIWFSPLSIDNIKFIAPQMVEAGFDIIELPFEGIDSFNYAQAAAIIKDHGLAVTTAAVIEAEQDLIHPNQKIRDKGMAYVRHCIEAANTLGATNLIGPMYSAVGRTWQATEAERSRDMDLLVSQLSNLVVYAADHGVTLCIEPLNRFETSFINLASQAIELVDRVDHPHCQIMLDTFHMNIEETSMGEAIRAVGPRLRHVHACENDRGAPGSGHIPWLDVAQALKDINYEGPVVIESFTADVKTIARAAAIWRPLAQTQDAIAYEGLAFLKKLLA
jgi:D-psicose/D-tagatose/L-ribulose 3-epimerase